jgi:xanthine dehydrogenase accessory factor
VSDPLAAGAELEHNGGSGALVMALDGPERWQRSVVDAAGQPLGGADIDLQGVMPSVVAMIAADEAGVVEAAGRRYYVEPIVPDPRLLLFGAGDIAEALCAMAAVTGWSVEVVDPRASLANPDRFPDAARVLAAWPEDALEQISVSGRDYVVSLLHEARFEEALFPAVLRSNARYVGALGSTRTHAARVERLRDQGFDEAAIRRIHGPVGLRIGAVTPAEIAVAILAEMVETRRSSGDSATR